MAAIFVMDTGNIVDVLNDHFYEDSFLMNMFPFLFGLVSKEVLRSLADRLIQIFIGSYFLLLYILHCLFETHDDTLCRGFGQVFNKGATISLSTHTLLEYRYVCYFIGACGIQRLNVDIQCLNLSSDTSDLYEEILYKYLQSTLTDIESFHNTFYHSLSHKGTEQFAKALSFQNDIRSVKLKGYIGAKPGCVKILCDSICKHNSQDH